MGKPLPHIKDESRQEELEYFNVLETLLEEYNDNLTALASRIYGTKIS